MPENTSRGYTYPVYTDPANFPAQIEDLARDIDTDMQSLFDRVADGLNQPACYVRANGVNQAIAANTDVTATFVTEVYDNANMVNLGVSNTTITFPESGIYLATSRVTFLSNGTVPDTGRMTNLVTNGIFGTVGRRSVLGNTSVATAVALTVLFFAGAGNTMTLLQRQNTSASLNSSTRMLAVAKVGAL